MLSDHIFNSAIDGKGIVVGQGCAIHKCLGETRAVCEDFQLQTIFLPDNLGRRRTVGQEGNSEGNVKRRVM